MQFFHRNFEKLAPLPRSKRRSRTTRTFGDRQRLRLESLESREMLTGSPYMVSDIAMGSDSSPSSAPSQFVELGDSVFFIATTHGGAELWKANLTTGQSARVTEGLDLSNSRLVAVDHSLYFIANDGLHGFELWSSDGTTAGTHLVKDIRPGAVGTFDQHAQGLLPSVRLTPAGDTLYLVADDGSNGRELWKSDGTESGTTLVKGIAPGTKGAFPNVPTLIDVGGSLFFTAFDDQNHHQLWKTDGSELGTVRVLEQPLGAADQFNPRVVGDQLFFFRNDANATQLWRTDGTAAGTYIVYQADQFSGNAIDPLANFAATDDRLYFKTGLSLFGNQGRLWSTDGTASGTTPVATVGDIRNLYGAGDTVYFVSHDAEIWKLDGSGAGTVAVLDTGLGAEAPGNVHVELNVGPDDSAFVFAGTYSGPEKWRFWSIDGSTGMSTLLTSNFRIFEGGSYRLPSNPEFLVYTADDGVHGFEPWISDGTVAGTRLLTDLNRDVASSNPTGLIAIRDQLYFSANTAGGARELWKHDTTETVSLGIAAPDQGWPRGTIAEFNGEAYFLLSPNNAQLMKTDGSGGRAEVVANLHSRRNQQTSPIRELNGSMYFIAHEGGSRQYWLWKSDGTTEGTVPWIEIGLSGTLSGVVDGEFYFSKKSESFEDELWKTDGTIEGTKRIRAMGSVNNLGHFTNVNGRLYFRAISSRGWELWTSDGTGSGTRMVKDINRSGYSTPEDLVVLDGVLYFTADDGIHGRELWRSDGTEAGTVMVKQIQLGSAGAFPQDWDHPRLAVIDNKLYLSANDGIHGTEIWTSDGTETGTQLLIDSVPGAGSSNPTEFTQVGNTVYFAAETAEHGRELWAFGLESNSAGDDRNQDGVIDVTDLDLICAALLAGEVTPAEVEGFMVRQNTAAGDANFDRVFDSSDLVAVFQSGKYDKQSPAKWSEGDWNCDGRFDSSDLIKAFQQGWYEASAASRPMHAHAVVVDHVFEENTVRRNRAFVG
jgi:ELWxxDGT repeat protein